tara:strand:+ start:18173 stop:18844 length:672 start_codon:yes stop_codon:yes gene_type:complete
MMSHEDMMGKALLMMDAAYDTPDYKQSSESVAWDMRKGVLWIAFGGTDDLTDVWEDLYVAKKTINLWDGTIQVHSGFWGKWLQVRDRILKLIQDLHPSFVQFVGHSAGGSMAICAYLDLPYYKSVIQGVNTIAYNPITFGAAKVIGEDSHSVLSNYIQEPYLFQNQGDPIPELPRGYMGYKHWGMVHIANMPWYKRIYFIRGFTGSHDRTTYKKNWRNKKDIL